MPVQAANIPARLPLVLAMSNRDSHTSKDAKLVNCYIETDNHSGDIWVIKRPGIKSYKLVSNNTTGLGCTFWEGNVYSIFGGVLYKDGVSAATGLDTTGGKYVFSSILGSTHKLIFNNAKYGYAYDTTGGISDDLHTINASFPDSTSLVKGWAYLGGGEYVMNKEAVIWGSKVNSVDQAGDWTTLNFISAQINPDPGVCLNQQLVYVIAFNAWSLEVFYNAGNATGSPLGNVQGSKQSYGCASANSVQRIDDVLFWLSTNESAQIQVAMMRGLQVSIISTKSVDRLLGSASLSDNNVMSWQLKLDGHTWYVVTIISLNITLAYDWVEDRWHQWTDENGDYFPIVDSTHDANGKHLLQHATDGRLYEVSNTLYHDKTSDSISVDIITPTFDAQTRRIKSISMVELVGDMTVGSVIEVQHSDDDYKTWSTPRNIYMEQDRPAIHNCGSARRRAWKLHHEKDTPLRIAAMEVQYDLGTL